MALPRHPSQAPKALKDLPKRKRDFLKHYVRIGDTREAYAKAGYKSQRAAMSRAYTLLKEMTPYLDEAFKSYVEGVDMGILSVKVISELATSAESEQVRLNAAKELKSMAIKENPVEQVVTHVHQQLSNEDLDNRLLELQDELFAKAPKLTVVPKEV